METTALIFAKYPTPGLVKTRLVPPLTHQQAADLHRAALAATCELVRSVGGLRSVLVATPDDDAAQLARDLDTLVDDHWTQGSGSLGERLMRAVDRAFAEGGSKVLLFGADSPTMPIGYVREAILRLDRRPAIMGPCDDGGYYLLGLAALQPALLAGIDWGSERVADQTRARAQSAGIDLGELPVWHDIDRWADLPRAAKALGEYDSFGSRRATLSHVIDKLLRHEPSDGS